VKLRPRRSFFCEVFHIFAESVHYDEPVKGVKPGASLTWNPVFPGREFETDNN